MTQSLNDTILSSGPRGFAGESCSGAGGLAFQTRTNQLRGDIQSSEQLRVRGMSVLRSLVHGRGSSVPSGALRLLRAGSPGLVPFFLGYPELTSGANQCRR